MITVAALCQGASVNSVVPTYTAGKLTINAPITAGNLTKSGPGMLILTTTQNYTGVTTIDAGTIQLSGAGQLPAGTTVNLYGATMGIAGNGTGYLTGFPTSNGATTLAQNGMLDLNGCNQTVAGLGGFTGVGGGAYGVVTNSNNSTASTLTVTGGGVVGSLQGNLSLALSQVPATCSWPTAAAIRAPPRSPAAR